MTAARTRWIVVVAVLFLVGGGCAGSAPATSNSLLSPDALDLISQPDTVVIDVRPDRERAAGVVPRAVHIVYGAEEFRGRPQSAQQDEFATRVLQATGGRRDARVVLYCQTGVRSQAAALTLAARGFANALSVRDGFIGNDDGPGLTAWL